MDKDYLLLGAALSRPSGEWSDDDYDVLAEGIVVGRIFKVNAAPVGQPWMWTLLFEHHKDRAPTYGYAATSRAATAAFAKSWRRPAIAMRRAGKIWGIVIAAGSGRVK